jgi:hypothetical protein
LSFYCLLIPFSFMLFVCLFVLFAALYFIILFFVASSIPPVLLRCDVLCFFVRFLSHC